MEDGDGFREFLRMPKVISIQVNRSQELNNTNSSRVIAWQDLGCWIDVGYTVIQKKHVAWRHSHIPLMQYRGTSGLSPKQALCSFGSRWSCLCVALVTHVKLIERAVSSSY